MSLLDMHSDVSPQFLIIDTSDRYLSPTPCSTIHLQNLVRLIICCFPLAVNISCEWTILQISAIIFYIKYMFFFSMFLKTTSLFTCSVHSILVSFCRSTCLLSEDSSFFLKTFSSVHCHIGGLISHSSSEVFSL